MVTAASSVTTSGTNSSNAFSPALQIPGLLSKATVTSPSTPLMPMIISSDTRSYPIKEILGEGGNGRVFRVGAGTPRGVTEFAVKILRRKQFAKEIALREVENLQNVRGIPHVLEYIDHFDLNYMHYVSPSFSLDHRAGDPPQVAILTKLLPCPDSNEMFLEHLTFNGTSRLRLGHVLSIGKQALEALQVLHAKGYIHCDIKPENMSYNPSTGEFTIFDFDVMGIVGKVNPLTVVGTRQYRAPECILSTNYNETIDIWSLGASLFSLYTGQRLIPTQDGDTLQPIIDHLHLLFLNMGKNLNPALIESAPRHIRNLFVKEHGEYVIVYPPSNALDSTLECYERIAAKYRGMEVWESRIYMAAELKGEHSAEAEALIELIGPMLRYETTSENVDENRVTASAALQKLNASREW